MKFFIITPTCNKQYRKVVKFIITLQVFIIVLDKVSIQWLWLCEKIEHIKYTYARQK